MTALDSEHVLRAVPRLRRSSAGRFEDDELDGLPEPVQHHFRAAVTPGSPMLEGAQLNMRGQLKLGRRWLPFRARELLLPHAGFVWRARVAGVISGSDRYLDGKGALDWKLLGLVPVVRASGPDVARSAAARGGGEAVWLPTSLLPRFGVTWTADDETRLVARYQVDDVELCVRYRVDSDGRLEAVTFDRWGDPDETGSFGMHPFGIDVTGYGTLGGYTVPIEGRAGWFHGTDRWPQGEFFRYRLTALRPMEGTR